MNFSPESSPKRLDRLLDLIESSRGSDKLLLRLGLFAVIATVIWLLFAVNQHFSAVTPTAGGSFTEGIIGTPRFVNPALALTRADQDVTALVYSGLMKISPEGELVNDLADSVTVSDDGLTYNIVLRRDVTFHDDTPLTARDVAYTIRLIQDPDLKSPLRGNWTDVTIEEIDEYELNVIIAEAYAPFIENFTIGIMPAHTWSQLPTEQLPFSQLNTEPIGSGPFAFGEAKRDTSGLITHYTLHAYRTHNADPKIDTVELAFFQNEEQLLTALDEGEVDATTYLGAAHIADKIGSTFRLIEEPLPRAFGVFFNQNRSTALRDQSARAALTTALDRTLLIDTALYGYGVPISGPTVFGEAALESEDGIEAPAASSTTEQATQLLIAGDWEQTDIGSWEKEIDEQTVALALTLRTSNVPLFDSLSAAIAEQWEALGVEVTTEQFEQTGLVQSVIRPRDFQSLLFGLDMSRSYDLYPFWHSSQQDDPGLNIAQYANVEVDGLLETARTEQLGTDRQEALAEASVIIADEQPAIFLFQPTMAYLISADIVATDMNNIGQPADRFSNIADWYRDSEPLWPLFRNDS